MLYISSGLSLLKVLPGQVLSIATDPNASYQIIPEPDATTSAPVTKAVRQGDSLIVSFADGTSITMQDYFINCTGENPCRLVLENQELDALLSLNIEETIIDEPLGSIVEANIFMTDDTNYSELLDQSIANNQLIKADFPAGTTNIDIADIKSPIETSGILVDQLEPSLSIYIADNNLSAGETTLITFTFNQPPVDFTLADINADNAIISNLAVTGDAKVYRATLTPTAHLLDTTNIVTVSASYTDILGNIGSEAFSANYVINTNYAPIMEGANDTLIYTEGDGAQIIDASLNLSDIDDSLLMSASISIGSGFNNTEDLLSFIDSGAITGSYNTATGVLSLSGSATISEYQSALQSVTYTNNNHLNPSVDNRIISWRVNDGNSDSIAATSTININPINDAPLLFSAQQQMNFDGVNDYLEVPNIMANQGLHASNGDFLGLSIAFTLTMDAHQHYGKIIDFGAGGAVNKNIMAGLTTVPGEFQYLVYDSHLPDTLNIANFFTFGESVAVTINHASDGMVSIYQNGTLVAGPTYVNPPPNESRIDNLIGTSSSATRRYIDGSIDNIAMLGRTLSQSEIDDLASGDYAVLNQDSATIFNYTFDGSDPLTDQSGNGYDATAIGGPQTITDAVDFVIGGSEIIVGAEILLIDADNTHVSSATISIITGFDSAEDSLSFTNTANISGNYNTSTGVMTLTGSATVEQYQDALRSVAYSNSNSANPSRADRTISWSVNDGTDDSAVVNTLVELVPNQVPLVFSNQQKMAFDGNDDYLTFPTILQNQGLHDSNGNFLGMSIAASVTMDAFNHFNRIIDLSAGGANNHNIYISNKWATSTLRYEINDGTSNFAVDVQNFFTLGQNVDLVINHASNGVVTIYRNGIEIDPAVNAITINNSPAPDPIIILTPVNVTRTTNLIGKSHAAGTAFFEGSMDNISLVARTLSEAEITTLASGDYSALNQDSATIFNYAFDGSDPLTDQSGNGYDATAIGGPQTITDAVDFVIGGSEIIVGAEILLIDADNTHVSSATISIITGFDSAEDSLSFTNTANISGNYNTSTGVMTLTGSATVEQYQDALRSVAYSNSNSVNPSTADRTISWSVNDGIDDSAVVNTLVELVPNQIPLVFSGQQQMSFDGIDDHLALPDIMANQGLHDSSGNFLGMSIAATVTIETLQNFGHILDLSKAGGVTDNIRLSNSAATTTLHYAVRVGGIAKTIKVADFFTENETINIVINHAIDGTVTIYKNGIAIDPSIITVTINSVVETGPLVIHTPDNITRDYNLIGNSSVGTHPFKGSMDNVAVLARTLSQAEITTLASGDYSDLNQDSATIFNYAFDGSDPLADQSINNNDAVAFGSPASISSFSSFAIGGMGATIADKIMLADADNTMLVSASINIDAGFIANEDLLSFTNTANINGNYDASSGVLTLTGSGSITQYQAALRSVTYTNINSINPDTTDRNISWRINDGIDDSQPVTTTLQLLALPTEITLTANNTGSSVSGFSGSLQATLTDSFDYQPMNPISSSPNHHYQPTNVGFHSVEAPGDDAVLNYDLNTHYRQFSNNNSFVIDLYGRDNYFTTDNDFDILIFDSSGVLLGSIENLALPDTSTAHLRVNVSDLLSPPLLDGDTVGAFRIIAHDSTTSNPNNYFTLMEIRAADIINISTEITLTANNIGSSVSGFSGSMEATLTDNFDYQPLNPISASPNHHYQPTNVGFHSVEAPGNDAVLNYDLNTLYTQFSNNNALVIDLYGRDSYNTTDDDFDILIFDHNGALLGSIENLALPNTTAPHLRVNVSELLSPVLADGDTIGAFRIIAHDSTTSNPNNYFTLMEIRAADLVNTSNEITLTANNTGSSVSGFSGSLEATLSDAFNYQALNPASPAPNQTYSSNAGFHGDELDGVDVVLNYDLNTQYTQSANNNALVIDIYGRDTNLTRDNDFDIQVFDASDTLLGTIEHLAIPDNVQAHLRVNITQALSAEINDSDTIAKFRIIGHDSILNGLGNGFTILEVRAAELILATPIILDLDGDGIETTTLATGVSFDIDGDGVKEHTAWVANDDALLVRDINGDGQINAANELFGSATRLNNGSNAKDGYAALADLDSNHDGVINAFDELFNELQTWQDRNSDAIVQEGELTYLKDSNVAELNLLASDTNEWQNDNLIGKQSQWTDSSGDSHQMADVWLNFTEQDDAALSQFSIELSSHSNSVELLFSQQISQTQTAPAFTSTNSSKLIHSVIENTPANVEVLDTSANDDALRNSSIVL